MLSSISSATCTPMPKSIRYPDWPFFARVAALYRAVGVSPPSRSVVDLHEIADEAAAVELMELIATEATSPLVALACAKKVLIALDRYRNERDFQARPSVNPLSQLQRARDEDFVGLLREHLANPDVARVLLAALLVGAREAAPSLAGSGTIRLRRGRRWALELAGRPILFRQAVQAALDNRPKLNLASMSFDDFAFSSRNHRIAACVGSCVTRAKRVE